MITKTNTGSRKNKYLFFPINEVTINKAPNMVSGIPIYIKPYPKPKILAESLTFTDNST